MMMGSLVKGHFEQFLNEYAKPGYEFEFHSSGAVLKNVELKTECILPSSLPFYVVSGFIRKLEFDIPFTSLGSQAVEVHVNDVLLILKPKSESVWSEANELDAFREERRRAAACEWGEDPLQQRLEDFMAMYFEQDGNVGGYKAQLSKIFQRVVNNVSIDIRGFHVRYEENVCERPEECHALGLNVERLVSFATNEQWQDKQFASQQTGTLRRVVKLENVNVYCDANSKCVIRSSEIDADGTTVSVSGLETMQRMSEIEKESNVVASKTLQWWDSASPRAHHYLISPLSAVSFQFVSTIMDPTNVIERRTQGSVSCHIVSDPAAVLLDTDQVAILRHIVNSVDSYTKWQHVIRKAQHGKMLSEITDQDSNEFYTLVRRKMHQKGSMSRQDLERLEELQAIFPLYRLTTLRQRGMRDKSTSSASALQQELPQEMSVVFEEGSLGMDIESNPQKFGHRGVRVNACVPESQAAKSGVIQPGFIIVKVGDVATDDLKYDDVLSLLKTSARPLNVVFRTAPKESMLTHHGLDKEIPPQKFSLTAMIESFSLSLVAADVRREVIRIFGSGLHFDTVAQLSPMGVMTSIHGSIRAKTIQCSDRWNSSMAFESQCIASATGGNDSASAADISFDIPLVPGKNAIALQADRKSAQYQTQDGGYARLSSSRLSNAQPRPSCTLEDSDAVSFPHIIFTFGHVDLRIIIEHWDKLLQCLDSQAKQMTQRTVEIQHHSGTGFPSIQELARSNSIDSANGVGGGEIETDLGVELLPSPIATILSGMCTGPATITQVTFACFQSTFCAKFLSCRFLRKDTRQYDSALALRDFRLHCVASENGSFLNLIEVSLHACTAWGSGRKQPLSTPRFTFGYVADGHHVGEAFDQEAEYISGLESTDAAPPQLSVSTRLCQDPEEPYNHVTLSASISNTEIRALELGEDMLSLFDMITPISQYVSLLPIKPPQAKRFYFPDITLNCSGVSIVLTDRPAAAQNQLFGYQLNGGLRYSCSDAGEECAIVEAGPVWMGLYGAAETSPLPPSKSQFIYNRFASNHTAAFDMKFTIADTACTPEEQGYAPIQAVNGRNGSWTALSASMLHHLFEQVQADIDLRWPRDNNGPLALHECCYNMMMMAKPNLLIDQMTWSLSSRASVPTAAENDTSSSSLSSSSNAHSGNLLNTFNLSSVVYRCNSSGDAFLPTIINNTECLEAACRRNVIVSCTLVENPDKDIYWKSRDLQVIARNCTELSSLTISGAQLHSIEDLVPMQRLREITLTKCDISNDVMERLIESAPKLMSLTLVEISSLTNFELHSKTLERLTMDECLNVRDNVITQILRDSSTITYLNLDGCRQLRHVTFHSTSLQELNVSRCSTLEDSAISSACTECPELHTLDCTWCYQLVDPRIVGHSLRSVSIYRCTGLSDTALTRLFSENPLLTHVDMSGVRRLATRKTLTYPPEPVDLFHRWFCRKAKAAFEEARFMIGSKSLRSLLLDDCTALTDEDVTLLSARCPRLETLSLNSCTSLVNPVIASDSIRSITARYAEKLSTHAVEVMLTNCPKVRSINLQGCQTVDSTRLHPSSVQRLNLLACAPYQLKPGAEDSQKIQVKIQS